MFRDEQYKYYVEQTDIRDELKKSVDELLDNIYEHELLCDNECFDLIQKLQLQLSNCKGKKVYGYLPKDVKNTVNEIMKKLADIPEIEALYSKWNEINRKKISLYYDSENNPDIPIEENKAFNSIKNAIIRTVLKMETDISNTPITQETSNTLVSILTDIVSLVANGCDLLINNAKKKLPRRTESAELTKIQEKKLAHGQRIDEVPYDDTNDYENTGFGMIM